MANSPLNLDEDQEENDLPLDQLQPQISPILSNPNIVENQAPVVPVVDNSAKTAENLLSSYAIPREADYQAPQIVIPQDDKETIEHQKEVLTKLSDLDLNYKKNLEDAEKRRFNSELFATIGNYLPGIIAGATAMNTKASVKPADMPRIVPRDAVAEENNKFKTDYDRLLSQYKTLKDGSGLSAKDKLYASIAQANLNQGAKRLNTSVESMDKNAAIRVNNAILADQAKNELSDKQVTELADFDAALASLSKTKSMKKGIETGPRQDLQNALAKKVGWDDPKVSALRAQIVNDLSERVKQLSGTAASDTERAALSFTLPSLSDNPQTFEELSKLAEDRIKTAKSIREKSFKKFQGKNVQGYDNTEDKPSEDTKVINGVTYKRANNGWQKVK